MAPTCGQIAWWRSPDLVALRERHGTVEHLVIQIEFMSQIARLPRAEFSVPGASKSTPGATGFADVVALASREIWEIKPKHAEAQASAEAGKYVGFAGGSCPPAWKAGNSYFPTRQWVFTFSGKSPIPKISFRGIGSKDPVLVVEGPDMKAELFSEQGSPGAITYVWKINGKLERVVPARIAWALRAAIVDTIFGMSVSPVPAANAPPVPVALPGGAAPPFDKPPVPPDDLPPIQWSPLVFQPGNLLPELLKVFPQLQRNLQDRFGLMQMPGTSVVLAIEEKAFNALVGARFVAFQASQLSLKTDPARWAEVLAIGAVGAIADVIGLTIIVVLGGSFALDAAPAAAVTEPAAIEGAVASGRAILVVLRGGSGLLGQTTKMAPIAAEFANSAKAAAALAAGTALFIGIPEARADDPKAPRKVDASPADFALQRLRAPLPPIGSIFRHNNADRRVAGIATNNEVIEPIAGKKNGP